MIREQRRVRVVRRTGWKPAPARSLAKPAPVESLHLSREDASDFPQQIERCDVQDDVGRPGAVRDASPPARRVRFRRQTLQHVERGERLKGAAGERSAGRARLADPALARSCA